MKETIKKSIIWWFTFFVTVLLLWIAYAATISFPSATPTWQIAGWKFMNYFNKMLVNTWSSTDGTVNNSSKLWWKIESQLQVAKSSVSDTVPWTWVQNKPDLSNLTVNSITFSDWTKLTTADWVWGWTISDPHTYHYDWTWDKYRCIRDDWIVMTQDNKDWNNYCRRNLVWWRLDEWHCLWAWWTVVNVSTWKICKFLWTYVSWFNMTLDATCKLSWTTLTTSESLVWYQTDSFVYWSYSTTTSKTCSSKISWWTSCTTWYHNWWYYNDNNASTSIKNAWSYYWFYITSYTSCGTNTLIQSDPAESCLWYSPVWEYNYNWGYPYICNDYISCNISCKSTVTEIWCN